MLTILLQETVYELQPIAFQDIIAGNESDLRKGLAELAAQSPERIKCFWKKLDDGRLRAYFPVANGVVSRTYTLGELTEFLFNDDPIFNYHVQEILLALEETEIPLAA